MYDFYRSEDCVNLSGFCLLVGGGYVVGGMRVFEYAYTLIKLTYASTFTRIGRTSFSRVVGPIMMSNKARDVPVTCRTTTT